MNFKKYFLFILFISCISSIKSQYNGGNYGSYSNTAIVTSACPLNYDLTTMIYFGGGYGSYGNTAITPAACVFSSLEALSIFKGGGGGIYGNASISPTSCVYTTLEELSIFKGGGYGSSGIANISPTTCDFPEPTNIFTGGGSSGVNANNLVATTSKNTAGPFITALKDTTIIAGNCITLTTTGIGASSYSWSPSIGLSDANVQNPIANPSNTTTYTVTGIGTVEGCRNTSSVTVTVLNNNGITSLNYPTKICNTLTALQEPNLTGITNGVFTSSGTGLKINATSGMITPNTSTAGLYTVTYTYGNCNNTISSVVEITTDCSTNIGTLEYPNLFKGGSSNLITPAQTINQIVCSSNLDFAQLIYAGGISELVAANAVVTQVACSANIDYSISIYAGGSSGLIAPQGKLIQGACVAYINPSNTIYAGGSSETITPFTKLLQLACTVPVGDNFYIGGAGTGYGNGSLTPTTGVITGTAVGVSSDTTICPGSPINLTATGATNYTWTPATGLSNTLVSNPVATPMTTTTYTVIGTGSGVGCINTAKVTVNVTLDNYTIVSYGAYNFDEADMNVKNINFINGPLNGTFSPSPSTGLSFTPSTGSFVPGLSTSGAYTINYSYTKGACSYVYGANINITKLPPIISYASPSIFYINYNGVELTPTNIGGIALAYEILDVLPNGLSMNITSGVISGTPTALVDNLSIRIRALNYKKDGSENWSEITTLVLSVKKPTISISTTITPSLNTTYGVPSTNTNFVVQGANIVSFINVAAPVGFEVSTQSATGYEASIKIYPTVNHVINQPLYIRLKKTAVVGNHDGNIQFTSTSADDKQVAITTSYVAPASLTITGKYFQKFYGSNISLGVGSRYFTAIGLVNDETIGSVTITPSGGTAAMDLVGYYTITPSASTGGTFSSSNYNINYVAGQYQVLYSLYNFAMTGNASNWVLGKVPIPKISGGVISLITNSSARYTATVPNSFASIIQRGVCWHTTKNPTISNSKIIDGATTTGSLTAEITGLTDGTIYYVRTFITIGTYTYYGPNVKFTTLRKDGLTAATAAVSGEQLHADFPALASGWYWIKSALMSAAKEMYVDMVEDGGGYDFYFITAGPSVSTVTEPNGGTALGLDLVMPRSKGHWKAMSKAVLAAISAGKAGSGIYSSFFQTTYGIYRNTPAGYTSYSNKVMRHESYGGATNAPDWKVKDGGRWWLRDAIYSEPNGDYTHNALLGLAAVTVGAFPNPYNESNITLNDGSNAYSTGNYYMVSTNTKQ